MNRAFAIIVSFLFLWSGVTYGFSDLCCCTRDVCSFSERVNDNCESGQDDSGNLKRASHHNASGPCFLSHCTCQIKAFDLSEFESVLPEHQAVALPVAPTSFEGSLLMGHPVSDQIHAIRANPLNILLRTCSFLS